ncbi:MAG: hypothetical protein NTW94_03230 [Legionellales bacterium]|nr:hypothetical protein [Legionellales bacterium]
MNKRLLWNFEINKEPPLQISSTDLTLIDGVRWECRYFWPEAEIITLIGLDDRFLELSHYRIKHREDTYYLLPDGEHNLKIREDNLFYKPLFMKQNQAIGFWKKVQLDAGTKTLLHPDGTTEDAQSLMTRIHREGKTITVVKEALIYRLGTTPETKLELARLCVNHKPYFSLCLESKALAFVESISKQLLGKAEACDYVTFLKSALP